MTDDVDVEFGGAQLDDLRTTSGDDAELPAALLPKTDALAVADVELLGLDALVVKDDAAIGQHAVDIGEHELDAFAFI